MKKYLSPEKLKSQQSKEEREKQEKLQADLKMLRNQVVFTFFMLNALFVVTVFLMQLHQDTIYIEFPEMGRVNITWIQDENEVFWLISPNRSLANDGSLENKWEIVHFQVKIVKEMLRIEPIGLAFILIFSLILVLQFIAMLFHRFGTLALILATTTISMCISVIPTKNGENGKRIMTILMVSKSHF